MEPTRGARHQSPHANLMTSRGRSGLEHWRRKPHRGDCLLSSFLAQEYPYVRSRVCLPPHLIIGGAPPLITESKSSYLDTSCCDGRCRGSPFISLYRGAFAWRSGCGDRRCETRRMKAKHTLLFFQRSGRVSTTVVVYHARACGDAMHVKGIIVW